MGCIRQLTGICLALILALTSGAMAMARGQATVAGSIVICTGTGPVSLQVDAQGQPVGPVHICPDCALHLLDAAAPPASAVWAPCSVSAPEYQGYAPLAGIVRTEPPKARAPPRV